MHLRFLIDCIYLFYVIGRLSLSCKLYMHSDGLNVCFDVLKHYYHWLQDLQALLLFGSYMLDVFRVITYRSLQVLFYDNLLE